MKNILLITDGFFHPPMAGRLRLERLLKKMDGYQYRHLSSFEKLREMKDLDTFHAAVVYLHHKKISLQALALFENFVQFGGGVLAIHSATASFKDVPRYFKILGGRFTGHGEVETYTITSATAANEPFDGLSELIVKDELYLHELQPGVQVHFFTILDNRPVPVVWTYRFGQGKVCYAGPGHRSETMWNESYQEVLRRGLEWVSS